MTAHHSPMNVLLRPTFIVDDIQRAIDFYTFVFDWTVTFDRVIKVDRRFPPAAPDQARSRLVVFRIDDPEVGGIGFMQYLDHPIAPGASKHRKALAKNEAILVVRSLDPYETYTRIQQTDAVLVAPPTDWDVVGEREGETIRLCTMSLFDPNGLYIEVNLRHPESTWPTPAT